MISVVPTGLVDSKITRLPFCNTGAMASLAALMYFRSALWLLPSYFTGGFDVLQVSFVAVAFFIVNKRGGYCHQESVSRFGFGYGFQVAFGNCCPHHNV